MTDEWDVDTGIDLQNEPVMRESSFCLCGRNPASSEVREDLIKAIALSLRYDLVQSGCLANAAAAFDKIFVSLVPEEVRNLERLMQGIGNTLDGQAVESASSGEAKPEGAWLH